MCHMSHVNTVNRRVREVFLQTHTVLTRGLTRPNVKTPAEDHGGAAPLGWWIKGFYWFLHVVETHNVLLGDIWTWGCFTSHQKGSSVLTDGVSVRNGGKWNIFEVKLPLNNNELFAPQTCLPITASHLKECDSVSTHSWSDPNPWYWNRLHVFCLILFYADWLTK